MILEPALWFTASREELTGINVRIAIELVPQDDSDIRVYRQAARDILSRGTASLSAYEFRRAVDSLGRVVHITPAADRFTLVGDLASVTLAGYRIDPADIPTHVSQLLERVLQTARERGIACATG